MNRLLAQDKRGESTILGYVLLIVLAIGLAGAVFGYLKLYVPKEVPQCPTDVKLSIEDTTCSGQTLTVTIANRGLFNVQGAYVRAGDEGAAHKTLVNCPDSSRPLPPDCTLYFNHGPPTYILDSLKPGERNTQSYTYNETGSRQIEIEPIYVVNNGTRALCTNAIVTKEITCT
jgi:hypothetical protein